MDIFQFEIILTLSVEKENELTQQIEKTLNVDDAFIIDKGNTVYKFKIEQMVYDVYLKDDIDSDILLITSYGTSVFENE